MTTKAFKRPDGRSPDETRKMSAKVGVIPNADGSAIKAHRQAIMISVSLFNISPP